MSLRATGASSRSTPVMTGASEPPNAVLASSSVTSTSQTFSLGGRGPSPVPIPGAQALAVHRGIAPVVAGDGVHRSPVVSELGRSGDNAAALYNHMMAEVSDEFGDDCDDHIRHEDASKPASVYGSLKSGASPHSTSRSLASPASGSAAATEGPAGGSSASGIMMGGAWAMRTRRTSATKYALEGGATPVASPTGGTRRLDKPPTAPHTHTAAPSTAATTAAASSGSTGWGSGSKVTTSPAPRTSSPYPLSSSSMTGVSLEALAIARASLQRSVGRDSGPFRCFVVRHRKMLGMGSPHWSLHAEEDGRFLMATQKRSGTSTGSNYLFVMDTDANATQDRKHASDKIVGKLRADFSGSTYHLYDDGMSPDNTVVVESVRRELGVIRCAYDSVGPGQLLATVPHVTDTGIATTFRPTYTLPDGSSSGAPSEWGVSVPAAPTSGVGETKRVLSGTLLDAEARNRPSVTLLANKAPTYDPKSKSYKLSFGGRVSQASVKNFQLGLVQAGDHISASTPRASGSASALPDAPVGASGPVVMQFGRAGKDKFILDVWFPLSPLQAFAMAIAAVDPKLTDRAGYDAIAKLGTSNGSTGSVGSIPPGKEAGVMSKVSNFFSRRSSDVST